MKEALITIALIVGILGVAGWLAWLDSRHPALDFQDKPRVPTRYGRMR